ncbi:MAG: hypothetical protein ACE5F1_19275 [Planctomycetota bacterium]
MTIIVHNGREDEKTVEIPLDGKGKGSTEFPVPADWVIVVLTHSTSRDFTIALSGR